MSIYFVLQENSGLVVPWILGFITFMALEAVAMVYSNVLRDHVNRVSMMRLFCCILRRFHIRFNKIIGTCCRPLVLGDWE